MNKRKLGNTGLSVSEIGFGSWQLGNTKEWKGSTDKEAIKLVHKAIEMGCNFFDTAPNYSGGKSEELLGKALKGKRDEVVISTKFGHFADGTTDYDPLLLRKSVENSLRLLQTDYVDSVLLHNPPFEMLNGNSKHFQILEELKAEGKIKAYGASVDSSKEILELINTTDSQVIEVMFNILYQEPKEAFKLAQKKGVGLIIKVPLDSGWLTGKYDKNSTFKGIRSRWTPEVIRRRGELVEEIKDIKDEQTSMVYEALRFILGFSAVSTVIPGIRNMSQLESNLAATNQRMDSKRVKRYEQFYQKYLAGNNLLW